MLDYLAHVRKVVLSSQITGGPRFHVVSLQGSNSQESIWPYVNRTDDAQVRSSEMNGCFVENKVLRNKVTTSN